MEYPTRKSILSSPSHFCILRVRGKHDSTLDLNWCQDLNSWNRKSVIADSKIKNKNIHPQKDIFISRIVLLKNSPISSKMCTVFMGF